MKKEKYESLDEIFTIRNLQALSWLMEAIEEESNKNLRDFLKIVFTSRVHLATKMMPVRPTRPFSSIWNEHSYWFAEQFMEQNVWRLYESAVTGRQGLLAAKAQANKYFQSVKFAKNIEQVLNGKADIYIHTGSSLELMEVMPKGKN